MSKLGRTTLGDRKATLKRFQLGTYSGQLALERRVLSSKANSWRIDMLSPKYRERPGLLGVPFVAQDLA
jgi:hypothetical protein